MTKGISLGTPPLGDLYDPETTLEGCDKLKAFIGEYDSSTYICYDNPQTKCSIVLLHNLIKCNDSISTTEINYQK